MKQDEDFWRHRANLHCLKDGDNNTKFIHGMVKKRMQKIAIHKIQNDQGNWLENEDNIHGVAVKFYLDHLEGFTTANDDSSLSNISRLITEIDDSRLCDMPTMSS